MKIPLIKISKDLPPDIPFSGKYREDDGTIMHGVYIREYKKTVDKLIINNGYLMGKYKYPRIENTKFSSPMVNDYNLHLCGGWSFYGVERTESLTRVFQGLKPMGFFETYDKAKFNYWKKECDNFGLPYKCEEIQRDYMDMPLYNIFVSVQGQFGEIFCLPDLCHDYLEYAKACKVNNLLRIQNFISSLEKQEIQDCLSFDYSNPEGVESLIFTGLILGYPIETTVSILWS